MEVNLCGLRTTNQNTSWNGLRVSLISVTDLCKQQLWLVSTSPRRWWKLSHSQGSHLNVSAVQHLVLYWSRLTKHQNRTIMLNSRLGWWMSIRWETVSFYDRRSAQKQVQEEERWLSMDVPYPMCFVLQHPSAMFPHKPLLDKMERISSGQEV